MKMPIHTYIYVYCRRLSASLREVVFWGGAGGTWQSAHRVAASSCTEIVGLWRWVNPHYISGHFRNLNWRYLPYIRPI